jgi:hypothetical protein
MPSTIITAIAMMIRAIMTGRRINNWRGVFGGNLFSGRFTSHSSFWMSSSDATFINESDLFFLVSFSMAISAF